MSVVFIIVLLAVMVGSGWTLIGWIDRAGVVGVSERWLGSFCLGCLVLYNSIFAVGLIRLDRLSMGGVLAGAAILALPSWRRGLAAAGPTLAGWRRAATANWAASLIWVVVGVSLLSLLVQGMAPPNDYDSLNYHISISQRDLEQGFIGPDWYGSIFSFFPALSENLYRMALALAGEPAAQPVTGLFGIFLALATATLVRRLGFGAVVAAVAALMVVSVRATVWELATCEVEVQLAVFTALAMLCYMGWRERGDWPWMVVFSAALAAGVLVKYHGVVVAVCFAPLVLWDLVRRRLALWQVAAAVVIVVVLLLPHVLRNLYYTSNPFFPMLHYLLVKDGPVFFPPGVDGFGRDRSLLSFLRVYWDLSILPTYYFDGAMLGAPYILAFAPFSVLMKQRSKALPMTLVALAYSAVWFWAMTKQVRFLITITPFLCVYAAMGASLLWRGAARWARPVVVMAVVILAANQGLFVGIYSLLRVPPAIGAVSALSYHSKTPTMTGAFYGPCMYMRERLAPDQWVLSLLVPHSYYCPQARAIVSPALPEEADYWLTDRKLTPLTGPELADHMERYKVAFVVMETSREYKGGPNSASRWVETDYSKDRMGVILAPTASGLTPLYRDNSAVVYDGKAVIAALRRDQGFNKP